MTRKAKLVRHWADDIRFEVLAVGERFRCQCPNAKTEIPLIIKEKAFILNNYRYKTFHS
jgi:hypothetical protein